MHPKYESDLWNYLDKFPFRRFAQVPQGGKPFDINLQEAVEEYIYIYILSL